MSEWCSGYYDAASYERYARWGTSPPETGAERIYRGGSWNDPASAVRAFTRHKTRYPSNRKGHIGLRPVTIAP